MIRLANPWWLVTLIIIPLIEWYRKKRVQRNLVHFSDLRTLKTNSDRSIIYILQATNFTNSRIGTHNSCVKPSSTNHD